MTRATHLCILLFNLPDFVFCCSTSLSALNLPRHFALLPVISLASTAAPDDSSRSAAALHLPSSIAPLWISALAILPLFLVVALALDADVRATPADRAALLFLAVTAVLLFYTPARKYFERSDAESHNAATFAFTSAMFVIYNLARRAAPEDGPGLQFAWLPDDKFVISYAAMVVVVGAFATLPFGFKALGGYTRALLIGALVLSLLSLGSFRLLSGYYKVGVTETLDPTPLVHILLQLVEYSALAILCAIATANLAMRVWLLRALPIVLLALWARHQFAAPPPIEEDE